MITVVHTRRIRGDAKHVRKTVGRRGRGRAEENRATSGAMETKDEEKERGWKDERRQRNRRANKDETGRSGNDQQQQYQLITVI